LSYRMMCLTAHPDDESGAFGGALLMAHDQGVETSVVCLTQGAAGSFRGTANSDEELAQIRRAEFEAASKALCITHSEILDYPDGALDQQNFYELARVLVSKIRKHRPQVVLTFGGDGGVNLHRDHTIISLAATAATGPDANSSFRRKALPTLRKSSTTRARPSSLSITPLKGRMQPSSHRRCPLNWVYGKSARSMSSDCTSRNMEC